VSRDTEWFVAQRAQSIATVILTRLPGLSLQRIEGSPVEFIAVIRNDDRPSARMFGVEVRALSPRDRLRADGSVDAATASRLVERAREMPFPAALLLIDIRSEEAWFGWTLPPGRESGRTSAAATIAEAGMRPATTAELHRALLEVQRWYARAA
jgi:hypothetical protein